jgi:hypothetical protein
MKLFTPIVFVTRKVLGEPRFIATRTWGVKNHVRVINKFCDITNLNKKQRQKLILTAKRNGKWSGLCD